MRNGGDVCKALAAGADAVMLGTAFARAEGGAGRRLPLGHGHPPRGPPARHPHPPRRRHHAGLQQILFGPTSPHGRHAEPRRRHPDLHGRRAAPQHPRVPATRSSSSPPRSRPRARSTSAPRSWGRPGSVAVATRAPAPSKIAILDFGAQYTQLIARRIRERHVYCEIHPFSMTADAVRKFDPAGIVLSGGPASVLDPDSPQLDPAVLELGKPVLGICYGLQLLAKQMGGLVEKAEHREYGRALVKIEREDPLFGSPAGRTERVVWMSHGDRVLRLPPGFTVLATSEGSPFAAVRHVDRPIWGVQFHPEVSHTEGGSELLAHFVHGICGCAPSWTMEAFVDERSSASAGRSGAGAVICALSGGVDSSVAAALVHRAIGDQLTCVFVDNGLLRRDEATQVERLFRDRLQLPLDSWMRPSASSRPGRRHGPGAEAEDHRADVHRGVRGRGAPARSRRVPRAGHAVSRRDRDGVGASARRRRSRRTTTSAACRSGCGSSWWSRCASSSRTKCAAWAGPRPRRGIRRAAAVPGPGTGDPRAGRGDASSGSRCSARPTRSSWTRCRGGAQYDPLAEPSRCCCRSRASG